ncbi:CoB--CoM heterodisulfide reductase iron-sulfur subunit B family protein [Geobacter sp.]|uniref:CoB--CoM heterodisulfide reductase iron-sulfur subunit B family protein n=1 Tax=Geobacter sp. TaxID=46610 RepID=UPI00262E0206|nr:CoB--CoM heterodisulfide reductase iron-sulfur subunit B family protein [Geobacter sp.]
MKYAYFLSCINESMTKEVDRALNLWKKDLGIELVNLEKGTCCGGSNLDYVSPDHFIVVNGRNLALAERMGLDLVTSCSTCLLTLRRAKHLLDTLAEKRELVNAQLAYEGLRYGGTSDVKHLLWVITEDYGLERLAQKVTTPLQGVRFAPFYGCHILRPSALLGRDDPAAPAALDRLVEALGGSVVEYGSRNKCCGFHTLLVAEKQSLAMTGNALEDAVRAGADYIVTPCPLCHTAFDAYQDKALDGRDVSRNIPVLHLSQMIGLALGYSGKELGIDLHMIAA